MPGAQLQHAPVQQGAGQVRRIGVALQQRDRLVEQGQRIPAVPGPDQHEAVHVAQDAAVGRVGQPLGLVEQLPPVAGAALLGLEMGQAQQHPGRQRPLPGGHRGGPRVQRRPVLVPAERQKAGPQPPGTCRRLAGRAGLHREPVGPAGETLGPARCCCYGHPSGAPFVRFRG